MADRESIITVHPRVCGERESVAELLLPVDGSSPRVWGTLMNLPNWQTRSRFIPACVGNAYACHGYLSLLAVHPRVCGERS